MTNRKLIFWEHLRTVLNKAAKLVAVSQLKVNIDDPEACKETVLMSVTQ